LLWVSFPLLSIMNHMNVSYFDSSLSVVLHHFPERQFQLFFPSVWLSYAKTGTQSFVFPKKSISNQKMHKGISHGFVKKCKIRI
ncbi:hypothetical protein, partial [Bacillus sp. JJ1764]|uniref:hypothetical protein n=1 Tax=Bacillus sp. JJ1764 TaxID=3122964 RepID=UPI003000AAB8